MLKNLEKEKRERYEEYTEEERKEIDYKEGRVRNKLNDY